jgi:hypothetical protein
VVLGGCGGLFRRLAFKTAERAEAVNGGQSTQRVARVRWVEACCGEAWAMSRVEIDGSNRCGRFKLGMGFCFVSARHLLVAGALLLLSLRRAPPGAVKVVPCCRCKVARAACSLQLAACSLRCSGWVKLELFDLAGTGCKRPASMHPAKRKAGEGDSEGELWMCSRSHVW